MKGIIITTIIILATLFSCTLDKKSTPPLLPMEELREGDIVLRRGCSFASNIILSTDRTGEYSHIGLVHKNDSGWCVIHAVNDEPSFKGDFDRVKIERIEDFFTPSRAKSGMIMHSYINDSLAERISTLAIKMVEDSVKFDSSFDITNSKELYCTEFIYQLYKSIGEDITEGRRTRINFINLPDEIIFPSDIARNKKLKIFFKF